LTPLSLVIGVLATCFMTDPQPLAGYPAVTLAKDAAMGSLTFDQTGLSQSQHFRRWLGGLERLRASSRQTMNCLLDAAEVSLQCIAGGVFLLAGDVKELGLAEFASFRVVPFALVNPIALALPIFEMLTGATLVLGCRRAISLAAVLLSATFAGMLLQARQRRLYIQCGCFESNLAPAQDSISPLVRNRALLGASALLLWLSAKPSRKRRPSQPPVG
jgi:hypothetical protein